MTLSTETARKIADDITERGWWRREDADRFFDWSTRVDRTPADVEKTVVDVLDDLTHNRVSGGAAEQVKGAAEQSLARQQKNKTLNDAIKGR